MDIQTVRRASILAGNQGELDSFFSRAVFVISHKSESLETLTNVLWYLPVNSAIVVVTNCPQEALPGLALGISGRLNDHQNIYLVHQKDAFIAAFFRARGVDHLLGADGRVHDGKGEGMYIGTLIAALLPGTEWVVFYDADNFVPSALLEYSLAMAGLFLAACGGGQPDDTGGRVAQPTLAGNPALHNIRIGWASKPSLGQQVPAVGFPRWLDPGKLWRSLASIARERPGAKKREDPGAQALGRCTRVVSPLVNLLLEVHHPSPAPIMTSNSGEQAFSMKTALTLRFSSAYSVETFLLMDLLAHSLAEVSGPVLFQQYQAQSPHFHQKGDRTHILRMIAESLGAFHLFPSLLTRGVAYEIERVCAQLSITPVRPRVYPALQTLGVRAAPAFLQPYRVQVLAGRADMGMDGEGVALLD